MTRILTLSLIFAASFGACAQTGEVTSKANAVPAPIKGAEMQKNNGEVMMSGKTDRATDASSQDRGQNEADVSSTSAEDLWLRYGMVGLYNSAGVRTSVLQNAGPHKVYAEQGDMAKISATEDHWVRRIDLSVDEPAIRPVLNSRMPNKPVTHFPNALKDEAKRRGIEIK